jgi:serine/threonine-protein kinase
MRGGQGGYRLDRSLGSGWSATGYLGHDETTGKVMVVVKIQTEKWLASRPETLTREHEILSRVGGKRGLIRTLGLGEVDGKPALVMERAPGRQLWGYSQQPLPPRLAVHIVLRLLDAIEALHEQGYKHNDLHPGNVFYDNATDRVSILDFGNATRIADEFKVANDKYGPPEQRRDSTVSMRGDATTDLYHAGGVLVHLLTAQHPHPARPDDIAKQLRDPALRAIVRKARARDPAQRYRTAAEMRAALELLL